MCEPRAKRRPGSTAHERLFVDESRFARHNETKAIALGFCINLGCNEKPVRQRPFPPDEDAGIGTIDGGTCNVETSKDGESIGEG